MKHLLTIMFVLSFLIPPAFCAEEEKWQYFASSENESNYYIYPKSVKREDNVVKIWARMKVSQKETEPIYRGVKEFKMLWAFDCHKKAYQEVKLITILENGQSKTSSPDEAWKPIGEGSVVEYFYETICKNEESSGAHH